jgi:hypothetical protein
MLTLSYLFSVGDIVNTFRKKTLGLRSLSLRTGPGLADKLKIPWTYCMSPALVPKAEDWGGHIGGCLSVLLPPRIFWMALSVSISLYIYWLVSSLIDRRLSHIFFSFLLFDLRR